MSRSRVLVALGGLAAGVALWWLPGSGGAPDPATDAAPRAASSAPPAGPEVPMPPPFAQREIRVPDPSEPPPSQTAAFCADENWSHLEAKVTPGEEGEFRIDADTWERSLTGTRAGIASWMAQCRGDGGGVRIIAADTGALLATYDLGSGLREPARAGPSLD